MPVNTLVVMELLDVTVIPASSVSVKPPEVKVKPAAVTPVTPLYVPIFKTPEFTKVNEPDPMLTAKVLIELLALLSV